MEHDLHVGTCCESSDSKAEEKASSCMLDLSECLLALYSSSSACRVKNLIYVFCREVLDPRTFAQNVSRCVICHMITNSEWKQCVVKAEFERDLMKVDMDVLYRRDPIEALRRQLQFLNVKEDVYFQLGHCPELDAGVHHLVESNLFLDIYCTTEGR